MYTGIANICFNLDIDSVDLDRWSSLLKKMIKFQKGRIEKKNEEENFRKGVYRKKELFRPTLTSLC